jgi:hypothetical protein
MTFVEKHPDLADKATAAATMEWLDVNLGEDFGHDAGVGVSLKQAEKMARERTEMVRDQSFVGVLSPSEPNLKEVPDAGDR